MQLRLKVSGLLVFGIMWTATPAVAQTVSKSRQITIVAIMPETLKLSINASDPAYAALALNAKDAQGIATTVSTAWSLGPGRANIATQVYVKPLSDSSPSAGGPSSGTFPGRLPALSAPVETMVTASARRGSETIASLPSSGPSQALSGATPAGTLKIQVQPVL